MERGPGGDSGRPEGSTGNDPSNQKVGKVSEEEKWAAVGGHEGLLADPAGFLEVI